VLDEKVMTASGSPVAHLVRRLSYEDSGLYSAAAECLDRVLPREIRASTVLIKPNFISRQNAFLSCTHPGLIEAVCAYFSDRGNRVLVGDSPAFGSARNVAAALDLPERLTPYGARIVELQAGGPSARRAGKGPVLARLPEEVELVVNLPKLKAHKQMGLSGATKNLFGLVPGVRKAVAHVRHGQSRQVFAGMLLDLLPSYPESVSLMDGIRAMDTSGPTDGEPRDCGILAASRDPVALDTALSLALGLTRWDVPLWQAASERGLSGAYPECITYSGKKPKEIHAGFRMPCELKPVSFHPLRLAKSICQRGLARLRPPG
jgi:uncharacterized protein (DUF362 family)